MPGRKDQGGEWLGMKRGASDAWWPRKLAQRARAAVTEDRRLIFAALACGLASVIVYRLVLLLALRR